MPITEGRDSLLPGSFKRRELIAPHDGSRDGQIRAMPFFPEDVVDRIWIDTQIRSREPDKAAARRSALLAKVRCAEHPDQAHGPLPFGIGHGERGRGAATALFLQTEV